jgi:hypothetical protein
LPRSAGRPRNCRSLLGRNQTLQHAPRRDRRAIRAQQQGMQGI